VFQPLETGEVKFVLRKVEVRGGNAPIMLRPQLLVRSPCADGPSLSKPLKQKSQNPTWSESELPCIIPNAHHIDYLKVQIALLVLRDYQTKDSPTAFRGCAVLKFEELVDGKLHTMDLPIIVYGRRAGSMLVSVQMVPSAKKD